MTFFEAVKSRERDLSVTMTQSAAKPGGYAVIGTSMRVLSFAKDDGACLSPKELGAHLEAAGWKNTSSTAHSMNVPITYSWGNEHARLSTTPLVVNGAFCLELINILYTH